VLLYDFQKGLGIALGIIDGIMRVLRFPQMFEILEKIFHHSFVKRAKIRGRKSERIRTEKMNEIPVDELPVEPVVVRNKSWRAFDILTSQSLNSAITFSGGGHCSVSSRECPLTASASGIHFSEIGRSFP
jgi:hypothetical protein